MKKTRRKAFNFLRSYFDVLNEIPTDKDKLEFLLAIINKQFLDENPSGLSFIANLSYESQRHQIEESLKGYVTMMGSPVDKGGDEGLDTAPSRGSGRGSSRGSMGDPSRKSKSKSKSKNKSNNIPAIEDFVMYAKTKKPNVDTDALKNKYYAWVENDWRDGNDRNIKNWKSKILNTLQYLKEVKASNSDYMIVNGSKIRRGVI